MDFNLQNALTGLLSAIDLSFFAVFVHAFMLDKNKLTVTMMAMIAVTTFFLAGL